MRIKILNKNAKVPMYASEGASGFDLSSVEEIVIYENETKAIPTGIAYEIPKGFEIQVRPRSGLSLKTGLRIVNSPGTLDSDYIGELKVVMQNTGDFPVTIEIGDRIAQGVLCPVERVDKFEVVDEIKNTERGDKGFGSSGIQ